MNNGLSSFYVEKPDDISSILTDIAKKEISKKLNENAELQLILHCFRLNIEENAFAETHVNVTCDKNLLGKYRVLFGITKLPLINGVILSPVLSSVVRGKIEKTTNAKVDFDIYDLKTKSIDSQVNIDVKAKATVKPDELEKLLEFLKVKIGAEFILSLNHTSVCLNNNAIDISINSKATFDANSLESLYYRYVNKTT